MMQIFHGFEEARGAAQASVLIIGNFDGIHLGHRSLIERARELALQMGTLVGLYTFWPHPQSVLRPEKPIRLLCTQDQKFKLLKRMGVDFVVEEPFTAQYAARSAESFVKDILADGIQPRAVITGENFHFGNRAVGTSEKLAEWLKPLGILYEKMPSLLVDNVLCSSSKIRELIQKGSIGEANRLLGRDYSIVGEVVRGAGRGRTIGIPTANLESISELIPAPGVYATRAQIGMGETLYKAATNIGTRPTFSGEAGIHIETHILGFDRDIYGQTIELFFTRKIRDEQKFSTVDELLGQIRKDIETAQVER